MAGITQASVDADALLRVACDRSGRPSATGSAAGADAAAAAAGVAAADAAAAAAGVAAADAADAAAGVAAVGGSVGDFGRLAGESRSAFLKREYSSLRPFVIMSLSYLLFTTTDGAIRMIVLLHAYRLGFSAWQTAVMFTLYEVAGVVTNLLAGFMGARWGIKTTLLAGLTMQLAGIGMLFGWREEWSSPQSGQRGAAIAYVTAAQMLCGVAKDLTKLGGKTVTKLVTPDEQQSRLFKIVSFITGWKNSMKGVGYFIGAAALTYSYYFALGLQLAFVGAAMPWAALGLSNRLGRARKENITLRTLLLQRRNVNVLSAARFFLFGARDLWFEVPLPFFMRDARRGLGWERVVVGAVLAAFIVVYGQVQSWTPQLVLQPLRQSPANKYAAVLWSALLTAVPAVLGGIILGTPIFRRRSYLPAMTGTLMGGIFAFCVVFAVNSSIHSYLIVRYSEGDKVAMNVGFYYMANAMGRLTGTLVSGALYTFAGRTRVQGFGWCFVASAAFAAVSALIAAWLDDDSGGLACGPCLQLVDAPKPPAAAGSAAAPGGGGSGSGRRAAEADAAAAVAEEGGFGAPAGKGHKTDPVAGAPAVHAPFALDIEAAPPRLPQSYGPLDSSQPKAD
ncbi:hypothetical protein Rsub_12204 [Raphidocelis subcapitata]|uniref:Uncharacterized protein n=1 Tax=Raphidocelis subcapitata TaxID=307507 RepID=A0A2V0PJ55_9CHLO|nr:hypothetical protein Rsub_12204 [Raphidocelis subcapitata]|eukprot:GBF99579.1 hypothetical protein Rsub_12204 [Raphidocelis subcapitata]